MLIFLIIMLILSVVGMFVIANKLDKDENISTPHNAIYISILLACGIFIGMFITLILVQLWVNIL